MALDKMETVHSDAAGYGRAEKFKKMPMIIRTVISVSNTLSTVHHQLAICERLFLEKENTCRLLFYNVSRDARPKTARMNAIIQKRMTTVVSGQPSCSKW